MWHFSDLVRLPARHRSGESRPRPLETIEDRVVLSPGAVSLGTAAEYGVLGLAHTKIVNSNVTVTGDEGVSQGRTFQNMAPSTVTGNVYEYAAGQCTGPGKVGGTITVNPTRLSQADTDAANASSDAAALTPTQTLGSVSSPTTLNGNGGLNVIDVNGDIKASLTLSGTSSDIFVVNVAGTLTLGGSAALGLAGGVTADHVLYNFTGSGETISTHVGNVLSGTILAPGGSFNLDGSFSGEVIGGGATINLLSGAKVNEVPFNGAPAGASLSGYLTENGSGLAGVSVTLVGTDTQGNSVSFTATAESQGLYSFTGLPPGTYTLELPPVTGTITSSPGTDNGTTDGVVQPDGSITSIVLGAGDQATGYDFTDVYVRA